MGPDAHAGPTNSPRTDRVPADRAELLACYADARARTLSLVADLDDGQLRVPHLPTVNPLLWELGHVAWFAEWFALRGRGQRPSLHAAADRLFDSANVAHDTRWDLVLPSRAETLRYMATVSEAIARSLGDREPSPEELALHQLCLLHEDMHGEAFVYMRQTLGHPPPAAAAGLVRTAPPPPRGDVELPGGDFQIGAGSDARFAFDNERSLHTVHLAPFELARAPVTQAEFLAFVEDGGYAREELWSPAGWRWRMEAGAAAPTYWRRADDVWQRRHFDRWVALEPDLPVCCVCHHEADAYCRWARRRLPTEAEWEYACAGGAHGRKQRYPWGDAPPDAAQAVLDLRSEWCAPVGACAAGDAQPGARQLIGNVWEWTASAFAPYPGFAPGVYAEYSQPWFGTHMVLRGGAFATRTRLIHSALRNFFEPHRRDVLAGFRTAAERS
jgi:iron(II)-dependent oxidoreductase